VPPHLGGEQPKFSRRCPPIADGGGTSELVPPHNINEIAPPHPMGGHQIMGGNRPHMGGHHCFWVVPPHPDGGAVILGVVPPHHNKSDTISVPPHPDGGAVIFRCGSPPII